MVSCMVFFGCGSKEKVFYTADTQTEQTSPETQVDEPDTQSDEAKYPYCVYICGAVNSPGVYQLPEGARICDVIEKAGGFTEDASVDYLNQAQTVNDGEMIYVPTEEEAYVRSDEYLQGERGGASADDGKININTATKEQLTSISGIGDGRAESIIKYRSEHGKFVTIEDIKNVSGIGDSIFENIKDYITVN